MGKIFGWLGLSMESELVHTSACSSSLHLSRVPMSLFSCNITRETQVGLLIRSPQYPFLISGSAFQDRGFPAPLGCIPGSLVGPLAAWASCTIPVTHISPQRCPHRFISHCSTCLVSPAGLGSSRCTSPSRWLKKKHWKLLDVLSVPEALLWGCALSDSPGTCSFGRALISLLPSTHSVCYWYRMFLFIKRMC